MYLLALWVKDGETDTLVPIAPAPPPLKAGESMAADRALALLAGAAKSAGEGDEGRS